MVLFLRMSHATRAAVGHSQSQASSCRAAEDPPDPPSLAEVMLEVERNKCGTNCLLARIEQKTARQPSEPVTIRDSISLHPPSFHHSIEPLDNPQV